MDIYDFLYNVLGFNHIAWLLNLLTDYHINTIMLLKDKRTKCKRALMLLWLPWEWERRLWLRSRFRFSKPLPNGKQQNQLALALIKKTSMNMDKLNVPLIFLIMTCMDTWHVPILIKLKDNTEVKTCMLGDKIRTQEIFYRLNDWKNMPQTRQCYLTH